MGWFSVLGALETLRRPPVLTWHGVCSLPEEFVGVSVHFPVFNRSAENSRGSVNHERTQIMEKARAKRRRREAGKSVRNATQEARCGDQPHGKVVKLAQGTAAQMRTFVKIAVCKITGAGG
jgi:hypothetical protein